MGEPLQDRASSWDDFGDDPESRVLAFDRAAELADAGKLSEDDAKSMVLSLRKCPDCGYALEGLHPSIGMIEGNGVALGPRACPECGARWPLVPGRIG